MKPDTAATRGGSVVFCSPIVIVAVGKASVVAVSLAALLPRSPAAPLPAASKHSPSSPSAKAANNSQNVGREKGSPR